LRWRLWIPRALTASTGCGSDRRQQRRRRPLGHSRLGRIAKVHSASHLVHRRGYLSGTGRERATQPRAPWACT
jgi:hypothetical protein